MGAAPSMLQPMGSDRLAAVADARPWPPVTAPTAATSPSSTSNATEGLATAALVVALIGLLGVVLLFVQGRRRGHGAADSLDGVQSADAGPENSVR